VVIEFSILFNNLLPSLSFFAVDAAGAAVFESEAGF